MNLVAIPILLSLLLLRALIISRQHAILASKHDVKIQQAWKYFLLTVIMNIVLKVVHFEVSYNFVLQKTIAIGELNL